ncbi:AraC family transcriptional regulator [Aquibacillus rhizosphaerae]|uniref:Helix-turn-helix domain-containing protein n=1 Tax=Aquibacillus rhizosphaerae TaxID=3051431 RepID=A0ABT7LEL1_9BACI|nr:helix-turn-helix domain-containing protein [Aquibacillus sp. LR5S19]MDL4843040.1 helix-turn-helix domain-containing protein [Aquibacillus sp. LR5S19]
MNLFNELIQETEEEKTILLRNNHVKKDLYTDRADFIIESEKFLSKEKMIMVRKHTRFVDFPKHKHDYIEINYVYNGELKQKVGNQEITLKKGELLLLNQYIEHEIKACSREDIVINFIIQPQFFDYIFSYLSADNIENNIGDFLINSLFNHSQIGQFLYFAVSDVNAIQELIHKIILEIMEPSVLSDSTIKLYMGLLMIELIKHSDKIEKQMDGFVQHQLIMESLNYIEEHFKDATLYELAAKLKQPHYWLSKNIKKVTSQTFKELLQEKRLREAKELLKNTSMPISTIVEQVGYDNISYFYRIFKSKYGLTPKKYREQLMNR